MESDVTFHWGLFCFTMLPLVLCQSMYRVFITSDNSVMLNNKCKLTHRRWRIHRRWHLQAPCTAGYVLVELQSSCYKICPKDVQRFHFWRSTCEKKLKLNSPVVQNRSLVTFVRSVAFGTWKIKCRRSAVADPRRKSPPCRPSSKSTVCNS